MGHSRKSSGPRYTPREVNQLEQEKVEPCTSCGKPSANSLAKGPDETALCSGCADRLRAEEAEERFDELFKAARALLREGEDQEDRIIPTLALANYSCEGGSYLGVRSHRIEELEEGSEAWERWADSFVSMYGSLRPVRVVDGILILERLPVSVEIKRDPDTEQAKEVRLFAYPHRQPAKPEHVGSRYERTLSAAGVPYGESDMGQMGFDFSFGHLMIYVTRQEQYYLSLKASGSGSKGGAKAVPFPTPRIVQEFYKMLLGKPSGDGFHKRLATRTRGPAPSADNLISACVAFYLRNNGKIQSRKEIHRLLNRHVLRETHKFIPEVTYPTSESNQLWRDVDNPAKVRKPLLEVERMLYLEGDIR